jgi:hypothetical protein
MSVLATGVVCMSLAGCARWDLSQRLPWSKDKEPAMPRQIVPMWTDTVLYQPGKPGIRGFGARIYFYEEDDQEPIRVEGALVVYAFDATNGSQMPVPEKKYVFTAEQFAKHYSKTNLGHSYSIWLPWDEVGGPSRQLSLITRFEGKDGSRLVTDPVRKLLPGLEPAKPGNNPDAANVQASYEEEDDDDEETAASTITIDVPPSFSRKLRAATLRDGDTLPSQLPAASDPQPDSAQSSAAPDVAAAVTPEEEVEAGQLPYHQRLATHFERAKRPARSRQATRQAADPPRRRPHRGGWLNGLPPTPRSPVSERPVVE